MLGNNAFKARLVLSNRPHSRHENEDVPTMGAMVYLAAGFYICQSVHGSLEVHFLTRN